jgi:hypothetical protein
LWYVVLILLVMAGLCMAKMAHDSLWYDEVYSMYYAGGGTYGPLSISETIDRVLAEQRHEKNPPGYYLLLNVWGHLVGWSEFATQAASMLAALITISVTYRLGADLERTQQGDSTRGLGIGAAVVLAGSAFFLHYSHELRGYLFASLFGISAVWCYWRMLHTQRGIVLAAVFSVMLAATIYMHYFGFLIVAVIGVYHVLFAPKNRRWWVILAAMAVGGVLYLPWIGVLLSAAVRAGNDLRPTAMTVQAILSTLGYAFSTANIGLLALLVGIALLVRERYMRFVWVCAAGSVIAAIALNAVLPVLSHIRYLTMLWPVLALIGGVGGGWLHRRGVPMAWMVIVLMGIGIGNTLDPTFIRTLHDHYNGNTMPWREVRAELDQAVQAGDVFAFHSPIAELQQKMEMEYYLPDLPLDRFSTTEAISGRAENDEYLTNATQFLSGVQRLWLGQDTTRDPNFRLAIFKQAMAQQQFMACYTAIERPELRLDLYVRPSAQMDVRFDERVELALAAPISVDRDRMVRVLLTTALDPAFPAADYSIGLYVFDASGQVVAQVDQGLAQEAQSCGLYRLDVSKLPAQTYTIKAAVYAWQTGDKLIGRVVRDGGEGSEGSEGDLLTLGMVTVAQ